MNTEVYVSIDGLQYNQLDLMQEESVVIKYSSKDLNDITKIFSPYSQDFTFEASKNNRRALGFFGDTDVVKIKTDSKYYCKIYVGGQLHSFGFLKLKKANYENQKIQAFNASFATSVTNLKDRIKEDTIQDLTDVSLLQWTRSNVSDLISVTQTHIFDGVTTKVYVPLISNNRVWQYSDSSTAVDNIKYGLGNIVSSELRPAIDVVSIIEFIKKKYQLLIEIPIALEPQLNKAFMWCNAEQLAKTEQLLLNCSNSMLTTYSVVAAAGNNQPLTSVIERKYTITQSGNAFKITKNTTIDTNWLNYCSVTIYIQNLYNVSATNENKLDILFVDKLTGKLIVSKSIDYVEGNTNPYLEIKDSMFVGGEVEFYIYMQFSNPVTFEHTKVNLSYSYRKTKWNGSSFDRTNLDYYQYENGTTLFLANDSFATINVFKALPNLKVIDFLTSLIKIYNFSIYDSSPDNENLFFLTPENINETNKVYSKLEVDYTPYLDITEHNKTAVEQYNYYNLKHATSKYRSNIYFKRMFNEEYGQVFFPTNKPTDAKEFKVETNFSIIPPIEVNGIITAYGFTNDAPTTLGSGAKRYKPNYNEATLFYNNGIEVLPINYGFETGTNAPVIESKNSYQVSLPFLRTGNNECLGFSELTFDDVVYTNSIFKRFYEKELIRLINPNVMAQAFTLNLPINEIYLNEFTENTTPTGFRLQNDIVLMENKFTILDATIDITTGKAKLNLLNY